MKPAAIVKQHRLKYDTGFTLIEIIISLVIAGILASIAGMGIVSAISGYAVVRENVDLSQKIQLAATRINRELLELTFVRDRDAARPYIVYETATGRRQAIAKVNDTLRLYDNPAEPVSDAYLENSGDILTDSVDSFTLNYFQGNSNWDGTDIRELSIIDFSLNLFRSDIAGNPVTITTRVHLRNNDNYGGSGAVLPVSPPTSSQYACFMSTMRPGTQGSDFTRIGTLIRWVLVFIPLLWVVWCTLRRKAHIVPAKTNNLVGSRVDGSALIGIIVTIMLFAALGAAIIPMISSSQLNRTTAGRSAQAYYLAESGMRYAASQYLNATGEAARYAALDTLHGVPHQLQDNQGTFTVSVNPYYFLVDIDPAGTTTLVTRIYGQLASGYSIPAGGGKLSINDTVYPFSSASIVGQQITFSLLSSLTVSVDTPVYPVAQAVSGQTVTKEGDLSLSPGSGDMFPDRNGAFLLSDKSYTYRDYNRGTNTLIGVTRTDGSDFSDFSLIANEDIKLKKFVKVTSTGTVGSGDLMASRDIMYDIQIPERDDPERIIFHEKFDNLDKWDGASALGAHEILDLGDNRVLRVTGITQSGVDIPSVSLIALEASAVQFNPDHFDAQVKIGYLETTPPPDYGYDPSPIPTYYSAGLCFRLTGDGNTYGLSFQRGNASASPPDNIENDLVPVDDMHAVVLWQATNNGSVKKWLAYKQISDVEILSEDVESGVNGWSSSGDTNGNDLWHISTHPPAYAMGEHAWYYGLNATRTYNTGNRNFGTLISPSINLCGYKKALLRFSSWHQTEPDPTYVNTTDFKYVDVSADGGATWIENIYQIRTPPTSMGGWQDIQVDLSVYAGQTIIFRFRFDTWDSQNNDWEGWYVDNIRMVVDYSVEKSTLLARFKDTASITFNAGGSDFIEAGDAIVGQTSGASAIVYGPPVLQNGSWPASNATGTLLLDHINGVFQIGERLSGPGGSELATLTGFSAQDHFIKAYFGSETGCGTPNTTPLDGEKKANPIDPVELNWPPDEGDPWTADKDYFQLIQWDALNGAVGTLEQVNSLDQPNTLIRSSEAALTGPGSTLGLHTFGKGSRNIYFDDFGYQSFVDQPVAISQPIQY